MNQENPLQRTSSSQLTPSNDLLVAPGAMISDKFVLLCDWQGRAVWGSMPFDQLRIGEYAWEHLAPEYREPAKTAIARASSLRESQTLELANMAGRRFRVWVWPLLRPDVAVCVLAVRIPANLELLTEREQECLEWLGMGHSTQTIADQLEIGLTTVHTHLRRCREKLGLDTHEALIAFAAKHCPPTDGR
ncbi:response regulator transcription factor [Lacipirellula sp.]|uniref:response regulator transcription factor n=1 Tax=Lacipirellula sp. TaxID=2691419 RepID=UPI003D0F7DA3